MLVDPGAFGVVVVQVVVAVGHRGDAQPVAAHQVGDAGGVGAAESDDVQVGGLVDVLAADRPGRYLQCLIARVGGP